MTTNVMFLCGIFLLAVQLASPQEIRSETKKIISKIKELVNRYVRACIDKGQTL
jgi:hypothetical protein